MGEGEERATRAHEVAHLTPERAALATRNSTAGDTARAVSITVRGDRAEVIIETEPASRDWVYCMRDQDGWRPMVSGNGPTVGWDDPGHIDWG